MNRIEVECQCNFCESTDEEELSDCCGAEINDFGLCSDCKEHCI